MLAGHGIVDASEFFTSIVVFHTVRHEFSMFLLPIFVFREWRMRRYSPAYYSPPRRAYGGRPRSPPPRRGYGGDRGRHREQNHGSLLVRNIPLDCRYFLVSVWLCNLVKRMLLVLYLYFEKERTRLFSQSAFSCRVPCFLYLCIYCGNVFAYIQARRTSSSVWKIWTSQRCISSKGLLYRVSLFSQLIFPILIFSFWGASNFGWTI